MFGVWVKENLPETSIYPPHPYVAINIIHASVYCFKIIIIMKIKHCMYVCMYVGSFSRK